MVGERYGQSKNCWKNGQFTLRMQGHSEIRLYTNVDANAVENFDFNRYCNDRRTHFRIWTDILDDGLAIDVPVSSADAERAFSNIQWRTEGWAAAQGARQVRGCQKRSQKNFF